MCLHKLGEMCDMTASKVFLCCCLLFRQVFVDGFGHCCASVRLQQLTACVLTSFVVVELCSVGTNSGHNKGLVTHGCFDRP